MQTAMVSEETKALVRRFVETWNDPDPSKALALVLDDLVLREPGHQISGKEGLRELMQIMRQSLPDLRYTIEDIVVEGDKAAVRITCRGTQRGEFMGITPTARSVAWEEIFIGRVVGGKIAEGWAVEDMLGLMQQLGAIPTGEHTGHQTAHH